MKLKLSLFLINLCCSLFLMVKAQNFEITVDSKNPIIIDVLEKFEKAYSFEFSYDADQMENLRIHTDYLIISFDTFKKNLWLQQYIKTKESKEGTYRFVFDRADINFCGTVKTSTSDLELSEAKITFGNTTVISNENGEFQIVVPRRTNIRISFEGMEPKTIAVMNDTVDCTTIFLEPNIIELNEVIVTDYLTRGITKTRDNGIKISPKTLGILPGVGEPDIFQSLQLIPGVSSPEEDPANLHIRGGTPDQNLVQWDGIKMYLQDHFFDQITSFNPNIVDKVKVFRSGAPVKYGGRISGIIDITSSEDLFDSIKSGVGFNLLGADAYLKIPLSKKIGILLAGRRSLTDIYESFTFRALADKVFQNTEFSNDFEQSQFNNSPSKRDYFFSDVNLKAIWKPSTGHKMQLSIINISNELDVEDSGQSVTSLVRLGNQMSRKNTGVSFNWTNFKRKKVKKTFSAYFSSYRFNFETNQFQNANANISSFDFVLGNKIIDLGYDLSVEIKTGKGNRWLFGQQSNGISSQVNIASQAKEDLFEENSSVEVGDSAINLTTFSEYQYRTNRFFLTFGVRTGVLAFSQFFFEPRLSASYELSDKILITSSLETRNQLFSEFALSRTEIDLFSSLPDGFKFLAIQDKFETGILNSKQITLGTIYEFNNWLIEIEGYYKNINNILPNRSFFSNLRDINMPDANIFGTGNSQLFGVDVLLKKRIGNYRLWGSYSFNQAKTQFKDIQNKAFTDSFNKPHNLNISQSYQWKNLECAMGWSFSSGLPFTNIGAGTSESLRAVTTENRINSERLPYYHRLDFSASYKLISKIKWDAKFGFSIRNLYRRQIPIKRTYFTTTDASAIRERDFGSLGFTTDIFFRVNF